MTYKGTTYPPPPPRPKKRGRSNEIVTVSLHVGEDYVSYSLSPEQLRTVGGVDPLQIAFNAARKILEV